MGRDIHRDEPSGGGWYMLGPVPERADDPEPLEPVQRSGHGLARVHDARNNLPLPRSVPLRVSKCEEARTQVRQSIPGEVVVAQLVEQWLLTPEIRGSNPVIGKFYLL